MLNIIEKLGLLKKNDRVYYSSASNASLISDNEIEEVLDFVSKKNIKLFRICFHKDDGEHINEMLMFHTESQLIGPLKQSNKPSLSYLVLKGEAEVRLFNSKKEIIKTINLSSSNPSKSRYCRLDAATWRTIESTSENFVFLEVAAGPFKDSDTLWYEDK